MTSSPFLRSKSFVVATATAGALLLTGGVSAGIASAAAQAREDRVEAAQVAASQHHNELLTDLTVAQTALQPTIDAGEATLAATDGQVSDNAVRQSLRDALDAAIALRDATPIPTYLTWDRDGVAITSTLSISPAASELTSAAQAITDAATAVTQAQDQWARDQVSAALATAQAALDGSAGKVLDDQVRQTLQTEIAAATTARDTETTVPDLLAHRDYLAVQTQAVTDAQAVWQAEQDRIAAAAAAAAQKSSATSSSSGSATRKPTGSSASGTSSSSSGSSSGGSSSSGSYEDKVRGLMSQYGCGGLELRIDDPRITKSAAYDFDTESILVGSGIGSRLTYIIAHECAHHLQDVAFDDSYTNLETTMNSIYGGSGQSGLEQNADCVTVHWGLSGQHYTSSCSGARGDAAAAIASGRRP